MDLSPILNPLNDEQRAAVTAPFGPTLVLAGAGSGKTRVLIHRIAWALTALDASPHNILAVTFTNKAAAEMRHRIEKLLGMPGGGMWVGTFHGIAHRLLRLHHQLAGLPPGFQILDSEDQQRLIKKLIRAQELDDTRFVPRDVQYYINKLKDDGLRPAQVKAGNDPMQQTLAKLYAAYEEACQRSGAVDFAELLLRAFELLRDNASLAAHYRARFRHVLVDEFQDTNAIQYAWTRLMAGADGSPFVVGDDDQSIYRWRGARVENLRQFSRDYPSAAMFRLEQNYRSTGNILGAANALIANNSGRLGKNLWTSGGKGEPIHVYAAFNERDEADFVLHRIVEWARRGGARREVAVLYRSNAQSRVFEEAFLSARVPYKVYGGLRFYERAEIKDALAYLRLVANRHDDASFERVVNLPTRGIGARTLEGLRAVARQRSESMWAAAAHMLSGVPTQKLAGELSAAEAFGARGGAALLGFLQLIDRLDADTRGLPLHEQIDHVIQNTGLIEHFRKDRQDKGEARIENLEELVSAARGFDADAVDPDTEGEKLPPLEAFLAHAALESGEGQAGEWEDCVQMMTLHTAKGLEFPLVFLTGMEDGLFPHQRSIDDLEGLEEERRLCYVGITRAMQQLYISYAEQRRLHGMDSFGTPSRFIEEIPAELVEEIRPRVQVARPAIGVARFRPPVPEAASPGIRLGARVRHGRFGDGVILNLEGQGSQARVQVNFENQGAKWLMLSYANLEIVR
ncbi:MAG: DNA helicase II [Steroidobacteraceae bacterium]